MRDALTVILVRYTLAYKLLCICIKRSLDTHSPTHWLLGNSWGEVGRCKSWRLVPVHSQSASVASRYLTRFRFCRTCLGSYLLIFSLVHKTSGPFKYFRFISHNLCLTFIAIFWDRLRKLFFFVSSMLTYNDTYNKMATSATLYIVYSFIIF